MKIISKIQNIFFPKLNPQLVLIIGFIIVILTGAVLLSLPFSLTGKPITFIDAVFTSASATCVTGLVVVDTGSHFSMIGQTIILILIQIGGLGVMSFSTLFLFYLRGRFGIGSREIIHETLSFFDTIDIGSLLNSVFRFTFLFEGIGAFLLTIRFCFDMPFDRALYTAFFHSISAFCNAGFSTFNNNLMLYRSDVFVNLVVMFLIVIGGIGFIVIYEINKAYRKRISFHGLSLHTKTVLVVTGILIVGGAALLLAFEYNVSLKNDNFFTKVLASFFQSITARTAGFNTVDISSVTMPSIFVFIALMFIGASPASCGGGIKTATAAVIFAFVKSKINDNSNVNLFYNTLPLKVISKAIVVVTFAMLVVIGFSFAVSLFELENASFQGEGTRFIQVFFEVASAFGTVGLSAGITSDLSSASKILISIVMLIGRVGPLTIATVMASKDEKDIRYAQDNILVG
ncbi:MAG: TrkH family potassium uptake protein [bacterium]